MDIIKPFMLEDGLFRGRYIVADDALAQMLKLHTYPRVVQSYLKQVAVLALALASGLKYEGVFSLQIKSAGPISTLFVDVTHDLKMRGYAVFDADKLTSGIVPMGEALGNGQLMFSVSQVGKEPYQGIVALTGETLVDSVQAYFTQSEQIKTDIVLREKEDKMVCILVQQMPSTEGVSKERHAELWEMITVLMHSVKDIELFSGKLTADEILFRLFHANGLVVFPDSLPSFECRCRRDKMHVFLQKLSVPEREELFQDGKITMGCQFCNEQYIFTKEDFK